MASSVLTPSLRPVSLNLSGAETQNLRRLVRRWRIALTAINETSRPPLIDMILPLSVRSLSILHGLLAISSHASERSDIDLNHHQIALIELHAEISAANTDSNMDSIDHILRLLSLSMLLGIFTINQCDGSWVQHNRGMLSLVRSADQSALAQVPLGRFLMGICALQDISALSLGRRRQSQKAWLSWMAPRSKDRVLGDFTALEVTVGHSEQFLDILAQISEAADDNAHIYLQQSLFSSGNNTQDSEPQSNLLSNDLERILRSWRLPALSRDISAFQRLAIKTAWETFHLAGLLFHWRKYGFHANLMEPIRPDRKQEADIFVEDIMSNLSIIVELGKTHHLSIANAMLWPIAVISCECIAGDDQRLDEIMQLLDDINEVHHLEQTKKLKEVLQEARRRVLTGTESYLSLEQVSTQLQFTIPLF